MKRIDVRSSNVNSIGYDDKNSVLEIEFKDRSVYQYYQVGKQIFLGLQNASSIGEYLDKHIKRAGYKYKKIR
jgi:hypothetical protein